MLASPYQCIIVFEGYRFSGLLYFDISPSLTVRCIPRSQTSNRSSSLLTRRAENRDNSHFDEKAPEIATSNFKNVEKGEFVYLSLHFYLVLSLDLYDIFTHNYVLNVLSQNSHNHSRFHCIQRFAKLNCRLNFANRLARPPNHNRFLNFARQGMAKTGP